MVHGSPAFSVLGIAGATGCSARRSLVWVKSSKFGGGLSDGASRTTQGESDRLVGLGVEAERGLEGVGRFGDGFKAAQAQVALAVAGQPLGFQGQQLPLEVMGSAAQSAQSELQLLGLGGGVGGQQLVDGRVVGDKGEGVGEGKGRLVFGVGGLRAGFAPGVLDLNQARGRLGIKGVEFFFAGHSPR